ncbi:MAG TPA: DUF3341 domain-containing protein [Chloroflexota bacterium]|jgi:hypothetical protein|nr:DUF3341 domain-containing protein [Chloroflexota bacterium]
MSVAANAATGTSRLYGIMAEFDEPADLVRAASAAYAAGYRRMDAYSPFPIEGLADAIGMHRSWIPTIVLICGILGGLTGYLFQVLAMGVWYPINVGGRPYNSIPSFVPVTFELTILFGVLSAVISLIILNRLPEPYHPVFNVERFARATTDRFFLVIEATDPRFNPAETAQFLRTLNAREVCDVPE